MLVCTMCVTLGYQNTIYPNVLIRFVEKQITDDLLFWSTV